jgi:hypothetical protein
MKKIVALLMALALFSTTVFAAPLSVAASLGAPTQAKTVATSLADKANASQTDSLSSNEVIITTDDDFDMLFSDVNAVALTSDEASNVEGTGFFTFLIVAAIVLGAATGGTAAVLGINLLALSGMPILP